MGHTRDDLMRERRDAMLLKLAERAFSPYLPPETVDVREGKLWRAKAFLTITRGTADLRITPLCSYTPETFILPGATHHDRLRRLAIGKVLTQTYRYGR